MLALTGTALLLLLWSAWFFFMPVAVFETSTSAKLEAIRQAFPIEAPVAGQIVSHRLAVGQEVKVGEVLVVLDSRTQHLALEQAQAEQREADTAARFSEDQFRRLTSLHKGGHIAESEFLRGRSDFERAQAKADSLKSAIERLNYEIQRRTIRSPVTGKVGEKKPSLQEGLVLKEGELLASVIPPGEFKISALFPPSAALGRVKSGQSARFRLSGFPSSQYGTLRGKVSTVSSEARDGAILVESSVLPDSLPGIQLQHGLPGQVEVEVERITPAHLALRAAGTFLNRGSSAAP
jgi:RND family efflux transporter MFP subunit